jgi:hypothetical protein
LSDDELSFLTGLGFLTGVPGCLLGENYSNLTVACSALRGPLGFFFKTIFFLESPEG